MRAYRRKWVGGCAMASPWLENRSSRRPPARGELRADVAVVGAGITGLTAALVLARAGRDVVVLEADRVGAGVTGHTTAKVTPLHQLVYAELADRFDAETARAYGQGNLDAVRWIADVITGEGIACDWRPQAAYTYATTEQGEEDVRRECLAARAAGLE